MSSKTGSNGILDGQENVRKFEAWQREVEDFKPYIRQGALSLSRMAKECGFKRGVFYTNPQIRDELLPDLIAVLEARGLLVARTAMPSTVVVQEAKGAAAAGATTKRLMEQNEAYKVEIAALRKELRKHEAIASALFDSGRLPW